MAGFSIEEALKSGFRLARREWKAVLAWGAGYMLFSVVVQLISVGGAWPQYLQALNEDPENAAAALEQASQGQAFVTLPLILILSLAFAAALYGGVCRAMLRPEERRFFFIRLGRRELWLFLTTVALCVLLALVVAPLVLAVFAIAGGLGAATGVSALLWGLLIGLPVAVGGWYVSARFSLAWVQAWDEERFVLLDAWRLTRGQGWRIVLMLLALMFLLLIVCVLVLIPVAIVAGLTIAVAGAVGGAAAVAITVVLALGGLVAFAALEGAFYTVIAAPYVEVYRRLKAPA
jgi:hypothetical protein